jgi:hypothetical protein
MPVRLALTAVLIASLGDLRSQDINTLQQEYILQAADVARKVLLSESMKPTAPLRNESSVFATTPCRGLSLSR